MPLLSSSLPSLLILYDSVRKHMETKELHMVQAYISLMFQHKTINHFFLSYRVTPLDFFQLSLPWPGDECDWLSHEEILIEI